MTKKSYLFLCGGLVAVAAQGAPIPDTISNIFVVAHTSKFFVHSFHGTLSASVTGQIPPTGDKGAATGTAFALTEGISATSVIGPGRLGDVGKTVAYGIVAVASGSQFSVTERVDAESALSYWIEVNQMRPLPGNLPPPAVPINVLYQLSTGGHALGGGYSASASIEVSVDGFNMGGAFYDFWDDPGSYLMSRRVEVDMTDSIPNLLLISLYSQGSVSVGDHPQLLNPHGEFSAIADPTFEIDPNYPYRDYFDLAFSPTLVSAVPEPASLLLVGLPVAAVLWCRRPRALTNGISLSISNLRINPTPPWYSNAAR